MGSVADLAADIPARHIVDESLPREARAEGAITPQLARRVETTVREAAVAGAAVILCPSLPLPVLSSPRLGLEAAIAAYRSGADRPRLYSLDPLALAAPRRSSGLNLVSNAD